MTKLKILGPSILLVLATVGCSKHATGQSVAVVNGEEISQGDLNGELSSANVSENADKKVILPQLLQRIIDRKLLTQAAIKDGIDRTPQFLSLERRMREQLLVQLMSERQASAAKSPSSSDIDKFIADNPSMFAKRIVYALNQLQFTPPANLAILKGLQADHSLESVAAHLNSLGIPFARAVNKLDSATLPPGMGKQIDGLASGEPFVVASGGKIVVSVVTEREQVAVAQDENRRIAIEQIKRQNVNELVMAKLKDARKAAKIDYQNGYAPKPVSKEPASGTIAQ
jgi:peptidyl-prolyl cis-trans isomerase C